MESVYTFGVENHLVRVLHRINFGRKSSILEIPSNMEEVGVTVLLTFSCPIFTEKKTKILFGAHSISLELQIWFNASMRSNI